ncbi:MAG: RNA methyltransferase [Lachnospiraceae bacterium]|nr:RNA methyltransferase [Lachnospiraceae bacterium]
MAARKSVLNTEVIERKLSEAGISDIEAIIKEIEAQVNKTVKQKIKEAQPYVNEAYDNGESFLDIYPDYDLKKLPNWVIEKIDTARVIGNSKQTVILPDGRKYQLDNTLNHMAGGEWTYFINSVINTAYKTSGEDSFAHKIRKIHPTPKPPQLMRDIIQFFTKENELVFDYFMGVGGTLLGAGVCGRRAVGVDLNPVYIDAYKRAANEIGVQEFECVEGDCLEILADNERMRNVLGNDEISLVLIDPPYGNMMSREKTGADIKVYGNVATPFTDSDKDFGNLELDCFFDRLKESVERVMPYMKKRGHVVIFIKDLQPDGKNTNLLHAEIVDKLNEIQNLNYKGMKIWADQTAKLFPYGYPFSFVANQIHQYILVFRKEK